MVVLEVTQVAIVVAPPSAKPTFLPARVNPSSVFAFRPHNQPSRIHKTPKQVTNPQPNSGASMEESVIREPGFLNTSFFGSHE